MKKHPGNQCARVLKALALLRLGKEDECQTIIEQVREENKPLEESTLQAMSICYRETQQRKLMIVQNNLGSFFLFKSLYYYYCCSL